jgi:hypothetical protein
MSPSSTARARATPAADMRRLKVAGLNAYRINQLADIQEDY